MRHILVAALAALFSVGCDKPAAPATRSTVPYSLTSQTVTHLHWRGKKQLATDTNAASLMRIWEQPESAAVETQVLDKLATAPWRLLPQAATTNFTAAAPLLRSLLEDCVQSESYLEVRAATNQPGEFAFAIQLPAERAALWQTNLALVLESLTGLPATPSQLSTPNSQLPRGWSLKKHDAPNHVELTRVGEWVVVGLGQDQNALFGDFVARILRDQTPLPRASAPFWFDTTVDLRRVAEAFGQDWGLPAGLPGFSVQVAGDGQAVLTRGTLDFPQPLNLPLEPWNLPTNIMYGRLGSFTAARGFSPWLASDKTWNGLRAGAPPNQFFGWASRDIPLATFFAATMTDTSNQVSKISQTLIQKFGDKIATNKSGRLEPSKEFIGLNWTLIPFVSPFMQASDDFLFLGLLPGNGPRTKMPLEMMQALSPTNLIYYDWEDTGSRIDFLFQVTQLLRLVLHKQQLPANSPSMNWLITNSTNLVGPCITIGTQSGPQHISFIRRSSGVGFTAIELHFLADWLESPRFPKDLNSFQDVPRKPIKRNSTNPDQKDAKSEKP